MASPENPDDSFVREVSRSIFDSPNGSILIHACNCQGVWGAGIARSFRDRYPEAYEMYTEHCRLRLDYPLPQTILDLNSQELMVRQPLGTALVIPPPVAAFTSPTLPEHWIVCLFTSWDYGRNVDSADLILNHTRAALQDLRRQLAGMMNLDYVCPGGLVSNRFNSGHFGVPWEQTVDLITEARLPITVCHPGQDTTRRGHRSARRQYAIRPRGL